jgi:hypothetical protein
MTVAFAGEELDLCDVASALRISPIPQLRRLQVETTDCEVIITGRVASFYLKQLAQETVRGRLGNRRLLNRVEVE